MHYWSHTKKTNTFDLESEPQNFSNFSGPKKAMFLCVGLEKIALHNGILDMNFLMFDMFNVGNK